MNSIFHRFATRVAHLAGTSGAFVLACALILVWVISGPIFGFSQEWQLVINTGTTIVTFLMIFLVQHTQNVDTAIIKKAVEELVHTDPKIKDEVLIEAEEDAEQP